jgi:hypothetical protein
MYVIKASGKKEPFSEEKVLSSIKRAGIPQELIPKVLSHVRAKAYDGINTWEIYHHISEFLGKSSHPFSKASYSLKQAIMMLGPTGYPFEDYIAKVLQLHGYSTQVRQILQGKCVAHEIDIVATKNERRIMIEAKFHNSPGSRSEIHVSMYTKARFDDVKEKNNLTEGWLVTNTKLTTDAITYAHCEGLVAIGWSYPEKNNLYPSLQTISLRELIESAKLYPITVLTTLSQAQKATLLANHIVLCRDVCENHSLLDTLSLSAEERQQTIEEISFVCRKENTSLSS